MTAAGEPIVHIAICAQIGADTFELGAADLTETDHVRQMADLLRSIADEIHPAAPVNTALGELPVIGYLVEQLGGTVTIPDAVLEGVGYTVTSREDPAVNGHRITAARADPRAASGT